MDRFESASGNGLEVTQEEARAWGDRLASELDPRLADVWSCVFGVESDPTLEQLAWFLRMAYLNGYEDGLTEVRRGALFEDLGLGVPTRSDGSRGVGA
ncbi:MAG: hypothetical protein WD602_09850 [Actinomycetota bacterium]